ncbi:hypothetical protein [Xenorhabdus sp. BG5]|uniref:hypothetical protein n=1 Tax=Xenorhabdus sp. BG5 TaxID=2782014 RepID=UPI00187FA777|nr:hypothetical protein [Xenorhabdus sp. BG5]MBE8598060.1 hypothetical protein [Xenorhabdus sp. BG5]
MIIRTATMQDIEAILSLYSVLFSEMAALHPDRMQSAEQDSNFIASISGIGNKYNQLNIKDILSLRPFMPLLMPQDFFVYFFSYMTDFYYLYH